MAPSIRMYLSLQCASDSPTAAAIATAEGQLRLKNPGELFARFQQSKGSIYQNPFSAVLIGYSLPEYDLQLFEQYTNSLFDELRNNQVLLSELSRKPSVVADFVININSMTPEERPIFFLSSTQISFLAEINSSLSFDGYLMFDGDSELDTN